MQEEFFLSSLYVNRTFSSFYSAWPVSSLGFPCPSLGLDDGSGFLCRSRWWWRSGEQARRPLVSWGGARHLAHWVLCLRQVPQLGGLQTMNMSWKLSRAALSNLTHWPPQPSLHSGQGWVAAPSLSSPQMMEGSEFPLIVFDPSVFSICSLSRQWSPIGSPESIKRYTI